MSKIEDLIRQFCPDGVEYVKLDEMGSFYSGLSGKSKEDFRDGNAKFITYVNIFNNPALKTDVEDKVKIADGEKQNTIQYGDLLFTGSSETPDECGMCSVLTHHTDENLYLNSFCFGFRFNDLSDKCPSFMKHLFRSTSIRKKICKTANGVTRYNISKKEFAKLEIPLPPLPVQEAIVNILDRFTVYAAELQAELQARQQQYNYYRDTLLSFEGREGVEWKKLGEVCDNLDRKRKPITASNRIAGAIPYYGASGIVDYVKDYIFDGDFLLVSEDGANLLTRTYPIAFSIHGKTWVNNHAHILQFEERATRKYVEYYLNSIDLSLWISAGAQPKLTQDNLNKIPIPVPVLSEQQRIVDILDRFDTLVNDLSQGLPAEIEARQQQYEYYRDQLLTFKRKEA